MIGASRINQLRAVLKQTEHIKKSCHFVRKKAQYHFASDIIKLFLFIAPDRVYIRYMTTCLFPFLFHRDGCKCHLTVRARVPVLTSGILLSCILEPYNISKLLLLQYTTVRTVLVNVTTTLVLLSPIRDKFSVLPVLSRLCISEHNLRVSMVYLYTLLPNI